MSRGVTLRTGAIGGVLRTGQGQLAGCYEQERCGEVLRTGQGPLAGCCEQDRVQWWGVTNRTVNLTGFIKGREFLY